ncbi:MAG: HAMP domain-containing sensor histidine kinase [Cyanobacteria bacterium J06642_12]
MSYLLVMAATVVAFQAGVYILFNRSLYREIDRKLLTLAQSASPSLASILDEGEEYLDDVEEVPWRDIFNRDRQSLEWFNARGELLARKGTLIISAPHRLRTQEFALGSPPIPVRAYTISAFSDDPETGERVLEGYIRASQSIEVLNQERLQIVQILGISGAAAVVLIGAGGLWLTRRALKPVEESFNYLKQFTADASHELRSPLTAISLSVDVLQRHPERIHPSDIRKIDAIASAARQMTRLTEDLLLLTRTDSSNRLPSRREVILLKTMLADVVDRVTPQADLKSLTLVVPPAFRGTTRPTASSEPSTGADAKKLELVKVRGDKLQLQRLFANLVENAIQYTPSGGQIAIDAAVGPSAVTISVEDSGIGIGPDMLPYIFQRFWRADRARSRRSKGSGLGLAIAQAIARQHGGEISVTSVVNVGSTFHVRLPILRGGRDDKAVTPLAAERALPPKGSSQGQAS